MKIQGSVALVTGANRGIGKAFVDELLARGASKVYAGVRDVATITDPRVTPIQLDVTDAAQVAAAAAELTDVTLVVNNAGVGHPGPALSVSLDDARQDLEVNYFGLIRVTQEFAPVLKSNGGGAIVNMLSIVSFIGSSVLSTYAASKAAAWSYSNTSRIELSAQGTQVVGVHVGFVDTDLTAGFEAPKVSAASVAVSGFDALEAGETEALADDWTRQVKAALSNDQTELYPDVIAEFNAALAS